MMFLIICVVFLLAAYPVWNDYGHGGKSFSDLYLTTLVEHVKMYIMDVYQFRTRIAK